MDVLDPFMHGSVADILCWDSAAAHTGKNVWQDSCLKWQLSCLFMAAKLSSSSSSSSTSYELHFEEKSSRRVERRERKREASRP